MSFANSLKWSFLAELTNKITQPLTFIILARFLSPEDFGIAAAATIIISFSQIFWEAGLSKAVIQYQGDSIAASNVAFWVNCCLGISISALLYVTANPIAIQLFKDPNVGPALKLMSLHIIMSALSSIQSALLQKQAKFKALFFIRLATSTLPSIASIPLAIHGLGYWALIFGSLSGQAIQLLIVWAYSDWRPSLTFNTLVAKQLFNFGKWVAFTGALVWFYSWADSLFISTYLGSKELGIYRTGNAFTIMIFSIAIGPFMPVIYSNFSEIQNNRDLIKSRLQCIVKIITTISIPIAFLIHSNATIISNIAFGDNWQSINQVIAILALTHGYAWTVAAYSETYRALGSPEKETYIMASTAIIYCIGFQISIKYGLEAFLWTRFALAIMALCIHLWIARTYMQVKLLSTLYPFAIITTICIPITFINKFITHNDNQTITNLSPAIQVAYLAITFCIAVNIKTRNLISTSPKQSTITDIKNRISMFFDCK